MGSNPTSSEKMFFKIQIISKDKQKLKKFQCFLLKLQKFSSTWNVVSSFNSKEVITVLKSPHINKTAQEQFEYKIYKKIILINSFKPLGLIFLLKKIKGSSFPGISLKITKLYNNFIASKKILTIFTPHNVIFKNSRYQIYKIVYPNFYKYIKLFDGYGEILLKLKYL